LRVAKRVLVVEDNELNLKLFCDLLRAHDYEAEGIRDAREALDKATVFAPDIIIMDIQMPHISGLDLIESIRRDVLLRRIPILAVTAYAGKGDEDRIREAGADAYVAKPISLMKFVEVVGQLAELADSRALA
jgi:two-component system, cell cycle response regulator DivK